MRSEMLSRLRRLIETDRQTDREGDKGVLSAYVRVSLVAERSPRLFLERRDEGEAQYKFQVKCSLVFPKFVCRARSAWQAQKCTCPRQKRKIVERSEKLT
eukprot:Selendium_serpulae@DN3059_c1_g1_i1.p1